MVGVHAVIIELLTREQFPTDIPSVTYTITPITSGCCFFSKIDLVRAYNQIPVHPDYIKNRHSLRPAQRHPDVSALHGRHSAGTRLLLRLPR
jgi:hypothetical protein